jgi:hypothetical protein
LRTHAKAPSAIAAASPGTTRARRTVFGMACLCVLGLTAFAGSGVPSAGAVTACPNEAFRIAQHATQLPDCRAFEKVSPAEKGNGDIIGDGGTNVASTDGDAVTLSTRTPFGDTIGSGVSGQTQYIARRSPAGWSAHAINPQPRPEEYQTLFGATRYVAFSDDLRSAVLWGYDFPAVEGDVPLRNNIYAEDTASRALQPVTMYQNGLPDPLPHFLFELNQDADWGVSADARHVAFVSRAPYLPAIKQAKELGEENPGAPGAQEFFTPNVYQWDDGVLSLAGILPDGSVPSEGSDVTIETGTAANYRWAMSADGSRQLFSSPPEGGQLYQRIDGERTVLISASESPSFTEEAQGVQPMAATPDGRNVFFATESPLLPEDSNGASDLYRWTDSPSPASEPNLELIAPFGGGDQVVGISDDGERVYTHTTGNNIVVWDHGTTHLVVTGVTIPPFTRQQLSVTSAAPGLGRLTPDGRYFAFASNSSQAGIGPTGEVTNGRFEMYLYDLANDILTCVSCPSDPPNAPVSDPESGEGIVTPTVTTGVPSYTMPGLRPHFLSDTGRVFFSTPEALVPQDTNGILDAYQYDPATEEVSLLSTGRGSDPATFAAAGPSGDDVFIVTRQKLVPTDTDDLVDLYDVRADGGFAEPKPSPALPCVGEACQPTTASPTAPGISSAVLSRGNLHGRRHARCAKNQRKVRHNGKVRCVKKRHAKHNRRAGR